MIPIIWVLVLGGAVSCGMYLYFAVTFISIAATLGFVKDHVVATIAIIAVLTILVRVVGNTRTCKQYPRNLAWPAVVAVLATIVALIHF